MLVLKFYQEPSEKLLGSNGRGDTHGLQSASAGAFPELAEGQFREYLLGIFQELIDALTIKAILNFLMEPGSGSIFSKTII